MREFTSWAKGPFKEQLLSRSENEKGLFSRRIGFCSIIII